MIDPKDIASAVKTYALGWSQAVTALKAVAAYQLLPELRAFWPFSSVNENGFLMDLSGQGRGLTTNNGAQRVAAPSGVPFVNFNGTSQYLSRADEAGLDFSGALTLGGWFNINTLDATARGLITKNNLTNGGRSYRLSVTSTSTTFAIDSTGNGTENTVNGSAPGNAVWTFIAGRFTPSTEVALFIGGVKTINTSSIAAAIFPGSADLEIARYGANNSRCLNGNAALCFLCGAPLADDLLQTLYQMTEPLFG